MNTPEIKKNKKTTILFDLISTQGSILNGGAEFTVKILETILERFEKVNHEIVFLFDSHLPALYKTATPEFLQKKYNFSCVDISLSKSISAIISEYNIDVFFVGIGQRLEYYSLEDINCKTFIVFHDLSNIEIEDNFLEYILFLKLHKKSIKHLLRLMYKYLFIDATKDHYINPFQFAQKENVTIITVSEYSKTSINYFFPEIKKDILVVHSPEKVSLPNGEIENKELDQLIQSQKKYFLILGADRPLKNVDFTLFVFEKFSQVYPEYLLVTIGKNYKQFSNHIGLPYLSSSDLENVIKNSYCLIYATLFEGYGYPPVEAMKYGKPIVVSNVCSMPEILEDAPVYFSPFYKVDLMNALNKVITNYDFYSKKSRLRYLEIKELQVKSLNKLIGMILNNKLIDLSNKDKNIIK